MIELGNRESIFIDCLLADDLNVAYFVSLWGTHTDIIALLADITNNKCSIFDVKNKTYSVNKYLDKEITKINDGQYKDLVNLWLFKKDYINGDNKRMLINIGDVDNNEVWQIIKELSIIPLLDCWQEPIVKMLEKNESIKPLKGYTDSNVKGKLIKLNDSFQEIFENMIKDNLLTDKTSI